MLPRRGWIMADEYGLEVSAPGSGKWRLVATRAVKQREGLQVTLGLWNGTLRHAVWQATAPHGEPLSFPASSAGGFGIPRETLRQACDLLTGLVRRALLTATAAPAPVPDPGQIAATLTPESVASAPEI